MHLGKSTTDFSAALKETCAELLINMASRTVSAWDGILLQDEECLNSYSLFGVWLTHPQSEDLLGGSLIKLLSCMIPVGSFMGGGWLARKFKSEDAILDTDLMIAVVTCKSIEGNDSPVVDVPGKIGFYTINHQKIIEIPLLNDDVLSWRNSPRFIKGDLDVLEVSGEYLEFILKDFITVGKDSDGGRRGILFSDESSLGSIHFQLASLKTIGPALRHEAHLRDGSSCETFTVDIVGHVEVKKWPRVIAQDYSSRKRRWPPKEVVDQAVSTPVQLVCKPQWRSNKEEYNPRELRLTFTKVEIVLLNFLNDTQRLVLIIARAMFYKHLNFEFEGREFPSYVVKTTLLWMLQKTDPEEWVRVDCFKLVLKLFQRLNDALKKGCLSYYFIPSIDLLSEYPSEIILKAKEKLDGILHNFQEHIPCDEEVSNVCLQFLAMYNKTLPNIVGSKTFTFKFHDIDQRRNEECLNIPCNQM